MQILQMKSQEYESCKAEASEKRRLAEDRMKASKLVVDKSKRDAERIIDA